MQTSNLEYLKFCYQINVSSCNETRYVVWTESNTQAFHTK